MMRGYPIGLFIAIAAIASAVLYLDQGLRNYWDFVAFAMVFGGTIAVTVIITPWEYRKDIAQAMKRLFVARKRNTKRLNEECMSLVQAAQSGIPIQDFTSPGLPGQVLKDGAELISLGLNGEKIQMILQERVHQATERKNRVANTLKSLAKYPPAFGLAGTVLGLVSLMRSVSAGATAKDTAVEMAIALVATMYGILMANLVVNPAGESVAKDAIEEMKEAEIAVQAVLLAANRTSILESQEMLNSFVLPQDRVNVLGGGFTPESDRNPSESEAA